MTNQIPAQCRTNLDGYQNVKWPKVLCAVPRVGEYVEGNGTRFRNEVEPVSGPHRLRVVQVTHMSNGEYAYVEIELNR